MLDINELEERYEKLTKEKGISTQEIEYVEKSLGIILPDDFKKIARFYNGGCLGVVDNYCFNERDGNNIVDETKRLRETINLPQHFVVLAEPSESIIVMDVENKPSVIWCDAVDVYNLETKSYLNEPDIWEDYSDFFRELLSDEEDDGE